jgi:hypothetical protein
MYSVSPVIHADSDDARKTTAGAMSSGWPMRPSGVSASVSLRKSPPMMPAVCVPSVSTTPGLIALTRILRGPSSLASYFVIVVTAPLVAL